MLTTVFSNFEIALALAAMGFKLIPCKVVTRQIIDPDTGEVSTGTIKKPWILGWRFGDTPGPSCDPEQLRNCGTDFSRAFPGIECEANGLIMIDAPRHRRVNVDLDSGGIRIALPESSPYSV